MDAEARKPTRVYLFVVPMPMPMPKKSRSHSLSLPPSLASEHCQATVVEAAEEGRAVGARHEAEYFAMLNIERLHNIGGLLLARARRLAGGLVESGHVPQVHGAVFSARCEASACEVPAKSRDGAAMLLKHLQTRTARELPNAHRMVVARREGVPTRAGELEAEHAVRVPFERTLQHPARTATWTARTSGTSGGWAAEAASTKAAAAAADVIRSLTPHANRVIVARGEHEARAAVCVAREHERHHPAGAVMLVCLQPVHEPAT